MSPRVEELGFRHILAYDHVLGADPATYRDWRGPYNIDCTFHEPLVLYGFLAGISDLELVTGIVIAPHGRRPCWPSRSPKSTSSPKGAAASASVSAGTGWSTRRSIRTSRPGAGAWRSRSACCDSCGPSVR